MTSERQAEQPLLADEATNPEDNVTQPTAPRVSIKILLTGVLIGIITISGLWLFVIRQAINPVNATGVSESDIQAREETATKGPQVAQSAEEYSAIDRRLISLSARIDQGFEAQQTHISAVKNELSAMAENIQTIKAALADLGENNQALGRQISAASSRLDSLAQDIRARQVVKRKPKIKRKPRPVKRPPFHIDAIDLWDDITYVAISQTGRVAFLKAGEQQSGWTVTQIDRLKGEVDLLGPVGQRHSVSLQR